jgi:hypothetical protein
MSDGVFKIFVHSIGVFLISPLRQKVLVRSTHIKLNSLFLWVPCQNSPMLATRREVATIYHFCHTETCRTSGEVCQKKINDKNVNVHTHSRMNYTRIVFVYV